MTSEAVVTDSEQEPGMAARDEIEGARVPAERQARDTDTPRHLATIDRDVPAPGAPVADPAHDPDTVLTDDPDAAVTDAVVDGVPGSESEAGPHDAAATADALPSESDRAQVETTPAPAVVARNLALHGSRGPVYGPVDLELTTGDLTLVQGPQGAGRSSLLLTLAGRMTPDKGADLTVLGEPLPRRRNAVQRRSAIAGFDGIDDLDESVTVGDLTRERLRWLAPWYRHIGRVSQQRFTELAEPVFGDRPLPRVTSVVWDLDEVDRMLLRIALAMAQDPELLVVDDVDQVHDTERRRTVWARLEALAATGLTVIASVASLDEAARVPWHTPPHLVTLATGPHALPA